MNERADRHIGARVANMVQHNSTLAGQGGTPTVTLRKSCDLCVRLKRACDGSSPCNLCSRRRETCTRSVKRKSGPAKGTKYTTRRQRLEAGIPDPPKRKTTKPKAKTNSPAAAAAVAAIAAATSTAASLAVAPSSSIAVPGEHSGGNGSGRDAGRAGAGVDSASHDSVVKRGLTSKKPSNVQMAASAVARQGSHVQMTPIERERNMIPGSFAMGTTGGSSNSGSSSANGSSCRKRAVHGGAVTDPKPEVNTMPTNSCSPPRSTGFFSDGPDPSSAKGRDGVEVATNGGNGGGDCMEPVNRGSISPLSFPALPWPSPSLAPTAPSASTTPAGAQSLEGVGGDLSRGRSTSPFGLLGGRPRRGGTREPPVEAAVGPGHYRSPLGVPGNKRYLLPPPVMADQRAPASECKLEVAMANGNVQPGVGDSGGSGGGGGVEGEFRPATRRVQDHPTSGSSFSGGQVFTSSLQYGPTSEVGSFDSSNALGAILDRRHVRGGGRVNNGLRGQASSRPTNGGNEENLRELGDAASPALQYSRQQQQQQQQGWDQPDMRFLPHPVSSPGAADGRVSSLAGDPVSRWQLENPGNRSSLEGVMWRGRDAPGSYRHGYQFHRNGEGGEYVVSGVGGEVNEGSNGGSRGGMMETARDILPEQAVTGSHGGGSSGGAWGVSAGNAHAACPRTVLIAHGGDDDDIAGVDSAKGWGVVDPRGNGGGDDGNNQNGNRGRGSGSAWAFNANAPVRGIGSGVCGGVDPTGVGGGVVGDGSDSDLGAVGLSSATGNAAVAAVANGSGSGGPGGRDNGGGSGGGVWTDDPLVLASPPASPAAKLALQKQQQQQQQQQHQGYASHNARTLAMPMPTVSGSGGVGDRHGGGGGGGSPFFSGAHYRGGAGMPAPMEVFRGGSVAPPATAWQQYQATGPGSAHRIATASMADSRAPGGAEAWVNDPGGSIGGNESFLGGSVNPVRDPAYGRGTIGHGGWSAPWAALHGKRAGYDRDGAWPAEYSI